MNEIKELREETGLSQSKFAEEYKIPVKSIQNWETDRTHPPAYVPGLIRRIISYQKKYGELKNGGD